jgi:hypothetical protein
MVSGPGLCRTSENAVIARFTFEMLEGLKIVEEEESADSQE